MNEKHEQKGDSSIAKMPKTTYFTCSLILLLSLITVKIISLHRSDNTHYDDQRSAIWKESFTSPNAQGQLPPIGNKVWKHSFNKVISTLQKLPKKSAGELLLNDQTLTVLKRAISQLPEGLSDSEKQRLNLLIAKSFAKKNASRIAELLFSYRRYDIENAHAMRQMNDIKNAQKQVKLARLNQEKLKRQADYFGEITANKIFKKENNLQQYLHDRRLINENIRLTEEQRYRLLKELQEQYTLNIKPKNK